MRKFLLLLVVAPALFAQKKPITLETLSAGGRGGGGGAAGRPTWTPDGKTFRLPPGTQPHDLRSGDQDLASS